MTHGSDPLDEDSDWLRALLRRYVPAPDIDDVVQSTWLAALHLPARPRPLLAGIARRLAALSYRRRSRCEAREQLVARHAAGAAPSVLATLERTEAIELVVAAVAKLPEPYRSTLLQCHWSGSSVAEIARRQGVSEAAVRKRLQRARDLVRKRVEAPERSSRRLVWWSPWPVPRGSRPVAAASVVAVAGAAWVAIAAAAAPTPVPAAAFERPAAAVLPVAMPAAASALHVDRAVADDATAPQDPAPVAPQWQLVVTVRTAAGDPAPRAIVRCGTKDVWADGDGVARIGLSGAHSTLPDRITARQLCSTSPEAPVQSFFVVCDGLRQRLPAGGGQVPLDLSLGAPLGAIRGTVVDEAGTPVPGVTVFLGEAEPLDPTCGADGVQTPVEDLATNMEGEVVLGEGRCSSALFVTTDIDGRFVLAGLRDRSYVLRAWHWRSARTAVVGAVPATTSDVRIVLAHAPMRRVHGRVVDPAGAPLADVRVVALLPLLRVGDVQDHCEVGSGITERDGTFGFEAPATATEVGARSPGLLRVQVPIPVDGTPSTLCTDAPHRIAFGSDTPWDDARVVEVLDAAERPLPAFPDGDWALGPPVHPVPASGKLVLWTRRDAAVARLRSVDGAIVHLLPLRPEVR